MTPPHPAPALAVLNELGPDGIHRLRRPMGVLVFRLGKLLCAAKAPPLPIDVLLRQDMETSLRLYPDLKPQEAGLRDAIEVFTQVLAELGRLAAEPSGQTTAHDTWGQPLPLLPLYRAIGAFAMAFPLRADSRRWEPQPGEESAAHAGGDDKPKARQDAQRTFATLLDACDFQASRWRAPFKSELAYAVNGMPYLGGASPRPARKGDCYWRKPKGSISPDVVVVPQGAPSFGAAHVAHAVELKFAQEALGFGQSQNLADMFGRNRCHVLHLGGMNAGDVLPAPELQRWIDALRHDPAATVTVPAGDPTGPLQTPATWHLGMFASAYFHLRTRADAERLALLIPQLHKEFQALTGHALTRYMALKSGAVSRKACTQENIDDHYRRNAEDIGCLAAFDAPTKESASRFEFQSVVQFRRARFAKPGPALDYLFVQFPPAFWNAHKHALRSWWLGALQRLQAVQAYMGLGMGRPPVLERHAFQEVAEFALSQRFLGLDVDKPFFMRSGTPDGMGLECGLRTPGFGVLVAGEHARRLGGVDALAAALRDVPGLHLHPCGSALWIEAGDAPALHPVEDGVPAALRALADALKPVRLHRLWMVSYPPNEARDDVFTPGTSAQWLRRFDADADADADAVVGDGVAPTTRPSTSPAAG